MQNIKDLPVEKGLDQSVNLFREGYLYIFNRRKSLQSDVFETRILGQKAICMGGSEAAEIFYDTEKFQRQGAAPNRVRETLFGENSVQTLDGQAHTNRKKMFMSIMNEEKLNELTKITKNHWDDAVNRWEQLERIVLYEETKKMLCSIACEWAGVPLNEDELQARTEAVSSLYESPAKIGPNHWSGRYKRNVVEKWISNLVEAVRAKQIKPKEGTALYTFSWHRDVNGQLLPSEVAAVEVINIIRPIIAIAVYINFIVLALAHYPKEKAKLMSDFHRYTYPFIHEVRRYYPFFPFVAARVKKDFVWNGIMFAQGTLTLFDIYGTTHDPKLWANPDQFHIDRFDRYLENDVHLYKLIPQGGGDYVKGHRCAGEAVTIEVMKASLDFFVHRIEYELPKQDLSYSLVDIPSIPKSKVILANVKQKR